MSRPTSEQSPVAKAASGFVALGDLIMQWFEKHGASRCYDW